MKREAVVNAQLTEYSRGALTDRTNVPLWSYTSIVNSPLIGM
jgi:hypothetical protein